MGGLSTSGPVAYPLETHPVTLYRRLGGPPGCVWTGAENLAPAGKRSPDRPPGSESLYRPRQVEILLEFIQKVPQILSTPGVQFQCSLHSALVNGQTHALAALPQERNFVSLTCRMAGQQRVSRRFGTREKSIALVWHRSPTL